MKAHQRTIGKNDEWLTPIEIIKPLGRFDIDPCTCKIAWKNGYYGDCIKVAYWTRGLELRFMPADRVFMNPPFNRYERPEWMRKMSDHNNGIMLIPAACETDAFFKYVWPVATGILFLKGRPHFHYSTGLRAKANSGCTICLVSYGKYNAEALENSGIEGKYIKLK